MKRLSLYVNRTTKNIFTELGRVRPNETIKLSPQAAKRYDLTLIRKRDVQPDR